ncbi:MAG: tetratricopeptide repeat protein [Bacteroidales bacterium]|nr:tetratricopeptide repeat protein [Bacteroidales bacterium]MDT8373544.1 tetratricopeptide repeat protein [Bacteroidales bacterium]
MASLIAGYEYDIFISYRQNDNRHDGWVTEFVDHLRAELEATFKEEISVYFDLNQHDGLLDTHDVDESLKEKLRCLIFIPIISRTYCDPKSFAWEHEFRAFIKQASTDRFGLKVTLHSGNVANRVLPVRIHELDPEDRELIENEIGGVLRAIDFIYREPGVNRPLTPVDDEHKNQHGTRYRNQINKTANAVREIISALQSDHPPTVLKEKHGRREPWEEPEVKSPLRVRQATTRSVPLRRTLFAFLIIAAFAALIFALSKFIGNLSAAGRVDNKSIAVLPFENIGADEDNLWLGDALTEEVISQLCKINDLVVRPRTSVMKYRKATKSIPDIGQELRANYIIEGSYQIFNEIVRITVKLINVRMDEQIWSDIFEGTWDALHGMQTDIAIKTASILEAVLTPEEKARIEKNPTGSAGAYKDYLKANVLSDNALYYLLSGNKFVDSISFAAAIAMYDKAIDEDPGFALAYAKRAIARSWGIHAGQLDTSHVAKCKADAFKAFELENDLAEARVALGFYNYYCIRDYIEALAQFSLAAEMDPANYQPPFYMAMVYRKMGEWQKSQELLRKVITEEPQDALVLINIGTSYTFMHSFDTAIAFFHQAIDVMPEWSGPYINLIETSILRDGNTARAREVLDTLTSQTGESDHYYETLLDIYDGKYQEALNDLQSSTNDDFEFPGLRHLMHGLTYSLLDDNEMAGLCYDSALVLYKMMIIENPDDCYSYSCCGLAYAGLGNATDAVIAGKTAVQLAGDDYLVKQDVIINLAKIYTMTGNYPEATLQVEYLLANPSWFSVNLLKIDPSWRGLLETREFRIMSVKISSTYKNL